MEEGSSASEVHSTQTRQFIKNRLLGDRHHHKERLDIAAEFEMIEEVYKAETKKLSKQKHRQHFSMGNVESSKLDSKISTTYKKTMLNEVAR